MKIDQNFSRKNSKLTMFMEVACSNEKKTNMNNKLIKSLETGLFQVKDYMLDIDYYRFKTKLTNNEDYDSAFI